MVKPYKTKKMESGVSQEYKKSDSEPQNVEIADSVDNFQKIMYELFEKNGIINDLRAYLRGHIINVLKSAQEGGVPSCQKHFIQRLELSFQALNILIAEYLLRFEFSYSLSVFVSEIPLANMVFHFAKSLMERSGADEIQDIRFTESDVWSILNFLGVPCDSEQASRIIQMYKSDQQTSLLICILKCQWSHEKIAVDIDKESEDSVTSQSSIVSATETKHNNQQKFKSETERCKHINYCKTCQKQILNIKNKYRNKKKKVFQTLKSSISQLNTKHVMEDIGVLEQTLVNELFHQLKSVYESEVEMMKIEEEKKIKRSMASHALQLQKERDEMEQSFKVREAELERNVTEKKKFLWGLARALREQHRHMSRAMQDVRIETDRLTAKEDSLRIQMSEAEHILQKRGEKMRLQISNELSILETHLNSMRSEREIINKERKELENLKMVDKESRKTEQSPHLDTEVISHYDLLKNELEILKKYFESSKLSPKCVVERSTITDMCDVTSNLNLGLNNLSDQSRNDIDDRLKNKVVNDFKKKNVNFRQSNLDEIYRDRSHTRSHSSGSSEAGDLPLASSTVYRKDLDADIIHALREENIRLKECSINQQAQLSALSRTATVPCACLGAWPGSSGARPATAPPTHLNIIASSAVSHQPIQILRNINTSVSANPVSLGWRKGAGEEFSLFNDAEPRVLVPGDTIPFVGVLRDKHNVNKRQMLGQWRAVRSRTCPLVGVSKRTSPHRDRLRNSSPTMTNPKPSCSLQPDEYTPTKCISGKRSHRQTTSDTNRNRDKSPKSVLKEAKAKLRNIKDVSIVAHEKSPNSVLREAKLRLRKLEIEAEAMEKSYLDFRRRQSELKLERSTKLIRESDPDHTLDIANLSIGKNNSREKQTHEGSAGNFNSTKITYSLHKLNNTSTCQIDAPITDYQKSMQKDFDKYLKEYQTKITDLHFRNRSVADIVSPMPIVYKEVHENDTKTNTNYIETPLNEFRKLYHSNRKVENIELSNNIETKVTEIDINKTKCDDLHSESSKPDPKLTKRNKKTELEILKRNINKIYNISSEIDLKDKSNVTNIAGENLLKIEVENINEIDEIQNISVVVQSTVLDQIPNTMKYDNPPYHNSIDERDNHNQSSISEKDNDNHICIRKIDNPNRSSISEKDNPNHISISESDNANQSRISERDNLNHSNERASSPIARTPRSEKSLKGSPKSNTRSISPEQQAHLTRNDVLDAIFNKNDKEKSNTEINSDLFKEILDDYEKDDFADNLSADVDNYNSQTDLPNSPISLIRDLQTSDDDNFWD